MKLRTFNNVLLTEETIMKTRKFFSDNCYACIEEVKQGKSKVYIPHEEFFEYEENKAQGYMNGDNDNILSFLQRAYYIQTGKSVALLP